MAKSDSKSKSEPGAERPNRDSFSITSLEQLKAIAHPLRQQLFQAFAEETATTKQVADRIGVKPTRLYHHVAKLQDAGLIELTKTRQVRGTTEKYFRAVATQLFVDHSYFNDAQMMGELLSSGVVESLLNNVRDEVNRSLAAETPTEEIVFAQAGVKLTADRATELRDKVAALLEEAERLSERNEQPGGDLREYRLLMGWYPRAN